MHYESLCVILKEEFVSFFKQNQGGCEMNSATGAAHQQYSVPVLSPDNGGRLATWMSILWQ